MRLATLQFETKQIFSKGEQVKEVHKKSRKLGDCLLISILPGRASKTPVESRGLLSDSMCILEAKSSKLDIKRCKPGILFISLQVGYLFKLVIMR